MASPNFKTVVVTGGAGRIAYSLIPQLCDGSVFGPAMIKLRLLDIEMCASKLNGIKMEIEDSCYNNIENVVSTTDPAVAFDGADVVIVLGGFPRSPGMERKDLIGINATGMKVQAEALNQYASRDCKVLVVANPCNTNCLVMSKVATNIPSKNFTGLTRLDQERLKGFIVNEINQKHQMRITFNDVRNVIIWGNHSNTQVPDVSNVEVRVNGAWVKANILLDNEWLERVLIPRVQTRGAEIIKAQGASSGMSAANAIANHLRDWLQCVGPCNHIFSMGINSQGNPYNIPAGLIYSFPCKYSRSGELEIVSDFTINESMQRLMDKTTTELVEERTDAEDIVGLLH